MPSLTLTEINIYPVKSLGGIALKRARVMPKGLEHDRRWMLIDEKGDAMTQRVFPRMALFQPEIRGEEMHIVFRPDPGATVHFPIRRDAGETVQAQVWSDRVDVREVSPAVSEWFTTHLGIPCRLVGFPEEHPRAVDTAYARNGEHVSLADAFPFLLIGQGSLDDLNSRLAHPVPMNRFRPNFVVGGSAPFAEDTWKTINVNGARFAVAKPCGRCVMTTVNQQTGEKGAEPLRTLSSYRKRGPYVWFGQNLIGFGEGEVTVGAAVIPE